MFKWKTTMKTKTLLAFIACLLSISAYAGTFDAKVTNILMYEQGDLVYVYPAGGVPNPPACTEARETTSLSNYLALALKSI
jgi:hypothetical protein